MPFITQCPHTGCNKFMLMEEDARGRVVECLVCKKPIELEPIVLDAPPESTDGAQHLPDNAIRFRVGTCPKCHRPIKVPPEKEGQAVGCLECDFWGIVR